MAKRKGSSAPSCSLARKKVDVKEVESTYQRLDKLPPEVWGKILDELESDDLFPLALSCRYFRQKQKELVARTRQSGKPHLALKTSFTRWPEKGQPASADYLRFCSKEKVSKDDGQKKTSYIRRLAAFHGHLPLLQELLKPLNELPHYIAADAAHGGQLETLQWLNSQKGFRLDKWHFESVCEGAAAGGQLEVLKWLISEGCPWNARICAAAAANGHLDVLKYAQENDCPWDYTTWLSAAESTRKWLQENGCPQSPVYDPSNDEFTDYDSEDGEYW